MKNGHPVKWGKKRHLVQSEADSASELLMGNAKDMNLDEEQWGIPDVCLWNMPTQTLLLGGFLLRYLLSPLD